MAADPSDSIKTNVIAGVITAVLVAIGTAVWAFAPNAWKWFTDLLGSIWAHLTSAASVPTWWLYLLYLVSMAAALTVASRFRSIATNAEPTFTDYTEDHFFGALWRWRYAHGQPVDTWAFCPRCDTVLVYSEQLRGLNNWQTVLHCETCQADITTQSGDRGHVVAKVDRQIDRKVRTGEWKDSIARAAKVRA